MNAGIKAPSNNHLREWAFVILRSKQEKELGLQFVKESQDALTDRIPIKPKTPAQIMYSYAIPRQYQMLASCPVVLLLFFKAGPKLFQPQSISSLNSLASIWCVAENIFLAATAEGLATSVHLPIGEEGIKTGKVLKAPDNWVLACYVGLGHPNEDLLIPQTEVELQAIKHYGTW